MIFYLIEFKNLSLLKRMRSINLMILIILANIVNVFNTAINELINNKEI